MPDSIPTSPPVVPRRLPREADRRLAERVVLEILRQLPGEGSSPPGLAPDALASVFWVAHLYFARSNPGYLTNWPLVRRSWGAEIKDAPALLRQLAEEGFVRVEHREQGPFLVPVYCPTGKDPASELPAAAVGAIRQALGDRTCSSCSSCGVLPPFPGRGVRPRTGRRWTSTSILSPRIYTRNAGVNWKDSKAHSGTCLNEPAAARPEGLLSPGGADLLVSGGRLIRGFGLDDFLTNQVQAGDDAPTLAVKALTYFCEGARAADTRFQVAVLAVAIFLNCHHAKPPRQGTPVQAARDLVSILGTVGLNEDQIRAWVTSHFG